MNKLRHLSDRIPRAVRIGFDLLLALALLVAWYAALGCPAWGEEAAFRRVEKAEMLGPSALLDQMFYSSAWPPWRVHESRLLIADDGDAILFYFYNFGLRSADLNGSLIRREKVDGLLLTTLPTDKMIFQEYPEELELCIPLFLFVDDPAAVKATIHLPLPDGSVLTMTQVRDWHNHVLLNERELDGYRTGTVRDKFFLFEHPITAEEWEALWSDWTNSIYLSPLYSSVYEESMVRIKLYDSENRLIRTVDYTIRSRAGDAHASE